MTIVRENIVMVDATIRVGVPRNMIIPEADILAFASMIHGIINIIAECIIPWKRRRNAIITATRCNIRRSHIAYQCHIRTIVIRPPTADLCNLPRRSGPPRVRNGIAFALALRIWSFTAFHHAKVRLKLRGAIHPR